MLEIGSPFKIQNEPYTIAATIAAQTTTPQGAAPEIGKRGLMATVVVLSIAIAGVVIFVFRQKLSS